MAMAKGKGLPAKLKGAGGPATGYGSDVAPPKLGKSSKISFASKGGKVRK